MGDDQPGGDDDDGTTPSLNVAIDALCAVVDPLFVAVGGGVANAPALWEALGSRAIHARSTPLRGAEILAERAVP